MQNNVTGDFPPQSTIKDDSNLVTGSARDSSVASSIYSAYSPPGKWQSVINIIGIIGGIITILGVLIAYFWGVSSKLGDI